MNEIPVKTANERLTQIRLVLRKSPAEFAEALCVSRSYIYGLEKEYRLVNDRIAKLVSMTFGVSEQWLKTGEGPMFDNPDGETRRRIEVLFDKLRPDFQNYVLRHIDILLELQDKCETPPKKTPVK
jgi:transcriptional regulator with XRE-family HTH domain